MFLWAVLRALAASPITLRTSVFVLEFSSASRWNSIVDSVPSICVSCFSYRFFLFRACRATVQNILLVKFPIRTKQCCWYISIVIVWWFYILLTILVDNNHKTVAKYCKNYHKKLSLNSGHYKQVQTNWGKQEAIAYQTILACQRSLRLATSVHTFLYPF